MGTRADFYVGKGKDAEWLGSIAFDGQQTNAQIEQCTSPEAFRHAVTAFLRERDDATLPEQGWPWPWDNSSISDCSYWHFEGRTWRAMNDERDYAAGERYVPADIPWPDWDEGTPEDYAKAMDGRELIEFPDMRAKKNVTFGKRSGLIIIGMP